MTIHLVAPYRVGDFHAATINEVLDYINSSPTKIVGLDTETTGLDPLVDSIIMLQIGDELNQFIIDARYQDLSPLKGILESQEVTKVMVNGKFDYEFLVRLGIRLENIKDCFLQERILLGGKPGKASLEVLSQRYTTFSYSNQLSLFEETLSKDIRKEFSTLNDSEFSPSHILYGAYDVVLPLQINRAQEVLLQETDQTTCARLENEYSLVLGDIETNGFYLDPRLWDEIRLEVEEKLAEALKILNQWLLDNRLDDYIGINWNSSKQVGALFKEIGIPIQILDKEKSKLSSEPVYKDSVQRTNIEQHSERFPFVKLYLTMKEYQKSLNTYGSKFLSNIHPSTGRVHSNYNQILNTGRMSSTSPNLQNIKRDSDYRKCFVPASQSNVLVVTDYAAQETRIMGDLANDPAMIDFFNNKGGDPHSFTASRMYGVEVSKDVNTDLRFYAKRLNFGIPYGMSEYKLAKDFGVPLEEARDFINRWFETFPGLKPYFNKVKLFVRENGYIVTDPVTKRRYYPPEYTEYIYYKDLIDYYKSRGYEIPKYFWSRFYSSLGKIEREAQNYPIQGTGASMTKYASILFRRYVQENDLWDKVMIVNIVHDEIVIECDRNLAPEVAKKIKWCMEESGRLFCTHIPMEATPVITDHWVH